MAKPVHSNPQCFKANFFLAPTGAQGEVISCGNSPPPER